MNNSHMLRNTLVTAVIIIAVGSIVWFILPRMTKDPFCFNFVHDMQFGDRVVAHPVNQGIGLGKIIYYLPEVPALQTALTKEGFSIDPYESTGGRVYAGAFFGPTTKSAVMAFQKKNGLSQTGEVDNVTLDKLAALYTCPKVAVTKVATSTPK